MRNVEQFTGQNIPVKVVKLNRKRGNVVVSRKLAVQEEVEARKHVTLEALHEGAVLTGTVKNLTEYGAFIDLGGIDGLLHVTDISYGRVTHPAEVLHLGDEITVQVLKYDPAKERVSLGMKQLMPDPWEGVTERFPVNTRDRGPRGQRDRLRRLHRDRYRRGRLDPYQRNDLVAPNEASFEGRSTGRSGGERGP